MGGDYSKVGLTFQEYFEKLGQDPVAGANLLLHC